MLGSKAQSGLWLYSDVDRNGDAMTLKVNVKVDIPSQVILPVDLFCLVFLVHVCELCYIVLQFCYANISTVFILCGASD